MPALNDFVTCVVLITIVALVVMLALYSIWLICDIVRLSCSLWCRRRCRKQLEEALAAATKRRSGNEV